MASQPRKSRRKTTSKSNQASTPGSTPQASTSGNGGDGADISAIRQQMTAQTRTYEQRFRAYEKQNAANVRAWTQIGEIAKRMVTAYSPQTAAQGGGDQPQATVKRTRARSKAKTKSAASGGGGATS